MIEHDSKIEESLEGFDQNKRNTLTRLITGSAFVAPVVASFAMQGMSIRPAHAAVGSSSNATVSDRRLKKHITRIGAHASGIGIYRFNYLWSDETYIGVIAQEVLEHVPSVVTVGVGGFLAVDYGALGMTMTREDARAA
jgi:Chaperone of endosialidase